MDTRDQVDLFTITSGSLPDSAAVLAFRSSEGISRLYQYEVLLTIPSADAAEFDPEAAVLGRATLLVMKHDSTVREAHQGVLASVEFLRDHADDSVYRVVLVPEVWRLTLSRHSRVFTDQVAPSSIPDIIKYILLENGIPAKAWDFRLNRNYPALLHTTQYKESDWDFIARLLEREGIAFFFQHPEEGPEKIIFCDNRAQMPKAPTGPVRFYPAGDDGGQAESMEVWRGRHAAIPSRYKTRDYDYLLPGTYEMEESTGAPGQETVVAWGDGSYDDPARRDAVNRNGDLQSRRTVFHGKGRLFSLSPGFSFTLEDHPRNPYNQAYLITEVERRGNQFASHPALARAMGFSDDRTWVVEVSAIPEAQQFRPVKRTPVPRIYGVEVATVDGPAESDYAQIDAHGRYRVKLFLDEYDKGGGQSSVLVRMLQPHGGNPEGFHFPLRKGTEVMLIFLGGDPDLPMIAGVAPNPDTPSVVTEANHTQNVVHTGSDNRIEMEDLKGGQYIDISTPPKETFIHLGAHHGAHKHNWIMKTQGNGLLHTDGDEDVFVGGKLTEHVVGDVEENYDSNQKSTVAGNRERMVIKNETVTVIGDQSTTVLGNQSNMVLGDRSHLVLGAETNVVLSGQSNVVVSGQKNAIVGGQKNVITGGQQTAILGGQKNAIIGGQTNLIVGAQTTVITGGGTIISPAGYKILAPGGVDVLAPSKISHTSPSWFEQIGGKFSAYTMKVDIGISASAFNAIKMDVSGLKYDSYAFKGDNAGLKKATFGLGLYQDGLKLASRGLDIVKAALHIKS